MGKKEGLQSPRTFTRGIAEDKKPQALDEDDWQRVELRYRLPRIFTGSRSGLSKAYGNILPPESTPALSLAKLRFRAWGTFLVEICRKM